MNLERFIKESKNKGFGYLDIDENLEVHLDFEDNEIFFIDKENDRMRAYKLPKRKDNITSEWILKKLESFNKSYYKNLTEEMAKLNLNFGRIYPASYGLGYILLAQSFESFKKEAQLIADFLEKKGFKFVNEFSEKHWIYRFKIKKQKHRRLY